MSEGAPDLRPDDAVRRRLDRLAARSRWAILWERTWPALWWPAAVGLAFLTASALGLWLELDPPARRIGVAGFGILLLLSLWPLLRVRFATRAAALDRLDRDAASGHRPARSIDDTLALGGADDGSRALWALHLRRVEREIASLRVAAPRPGMVRRDPWALRMTGALLACAAAIVAGPELGRRVSTAFDWSGAAPIGPVSRVDGWIDPPHYTRLPPLMIDVAAGSQRLRAPVGSTVVVRVAGTADATVTPGPGLEPLTSPDKPATGLREERFRLSGSADLRISTGLVGGATLHVDAVPDHPPEISFAGTPEPDGRGGLTLTYRAKDDYGIAEADGIVEKAGAAAGRRSLVEPPKVVLALPSDPRSGEETTSTLDLADHPWAGARVRLTLRAKDEAGQEGRSGTMDVTLPGRPFTNPLARALVEQRRALVLDPDRRGPVQLALDALLIAPDRFTPQWGVFLGLRTASERLRGAKGDEDLLDVADWLWTMALQLEEGGLSDAEQQLRAAQEQLRDALDRGANEDEIRRLTEQLRTAMDKFLREFAERMQNEKGGTERQPNGQERVLTQNDLNRMLDRMQDAMRRGDTAEAQRLLDQLKDILNNLKTARPGDRSTDPLAREMNRQMDELDRLTRDQQELRDETFRERGQRGAQNRQGQRQRGGQQQAGPRAPGQQPGEEDGDDGEQGAENGGGAQNGQDRARRQGELRDRLQQLQKRMRGLGMQGEQGLADAEGEMGDAQGQLGQGRNGNAVDAQGRALEGLRRGMQGMAQQMQNMMGEGSGQEDGEPGGPGSPRGRADNDARSDDPLGRPTRSREFSDGRVRIPGADESGVERARRILDELRRKLGDPERPREELDYFERLLRPN